MGDDYGASTYGDRIAGIYDQWIEDAGIGASTDDAVAFIAEVAGKGPALELGIGTGRIALPLVERGVEVHGVDASEEMVAKLRAKPGGADIPVTMGDFAGVPVEGNFRLIYIPFNTFFGLLTQEDQVRCFRSAAAHLTPDGAFMIDAFVPDLSRFDRGQRVDTTHVESDLVEINVAKHRPASQTVVSAHVMFTESGTRIYPVRIRYAWPAELDLMAQLAGLRLRERWGGWHREPFTDASVWHVSVYELAG
jgi:SAM-dependent methyltransferase